MCLCTFFHFQIIFTAAAILILFLVFWNFFYRWWLNFLKSVFFEDKNMYERYFRQKIEGEVSLVGDFDKFILKEYDGKILFVIGEWGSGKTHHAMNYLGKKRKVNFYYKSFFGINTLDEAYQHLLKWWWQVVLTIAFAMGLYFLGIFGYLYENKDELEGFVATGLFGLITFAFLRNKLKIFSLIGFTVFTSLRKRILVIDDLDRSSMSPSDQWALLSNLWKMNTKYIVLLGYNSQSKKEESIEMAHKLEGDVVLLHTDQDTNLKLAQKEDPEFPFTGDDPDYMGSVPNSLDWLNYITPRQLIAIVDEVKMESEKMEKLIKPYKAFSYISKVVDCLSNNLSLNYFDRQNIVFRNQVTDSVSNVYDTDDPKEKPQLRFSTRSESSAPLARDIIKKIYKSLKKTDKVLFEKVLEHITDKGAFPSVFRFNMSEKELLRLYLSSFEKV